MSNIAAAAAAADSTPAPKQQMALMDWDASNPDGSGIVHTTPPPELIIPRGPSLMFMRGDFNGVTVDKNKWPDSYFRSLNLIGTNSTPYQMIMTPQLILYPRKFQDAFLTEYCERGFTHITTAPDGWSLADNGFGFTPQSYVQWNRYLQSWGLFVVGWRSSPITGDPFLRACVNSRAADWWIPGEEVDGKVSSTQYEVVLDDTLVTVANGLPLGAHFTSDWPHGAPRDDYLKCPAKYNGRVHYVWQADQNESAGTQGGQLFYARRRVYLGELSPDVPPNPACAAPDSLIILHEIMATAQLFGYCGAQWKSIYEEMTGELYGNLRTLELLQAPAGPTLKGLSGFNNGCRWSNGKPL